MASAVEAPGFSHGEIAAPKNGFSHGGQG